MMMKCEIILFSKQEVNKLLISEAAEAKIHGGKKAAYETVLDAILQPDGHRVRKRKSSKKAASKTQLSLFKMYLFLFSFF